MLVGGFGAFFRDCKRTAMADRPLKLLSKNRPDAGTFDIPIQRTIFGRGLSVRVFEIASRQHGHSARMSFWERAAMGDKFPKHIYHSIICIGALVAHRENGHWIVDALGAPHVGDRPEKALIFSFVDRIAELSPQLITFNGSSFDLPVLRYRAMVHVLRHPD
jgi:hypothetical protein